MPKIIIYLLPSRPETSNTLHDGSNNPFDRNTLPTHLQTARHPSLPHFSLLTRLTPSQAEPNLSRNLWPLLSTLSPHTSTALNLLASLLALLPSFLLTITLYIRRHYSRKCLDFDIECTNSHHGSLGKSGAYERFGLSIFTEADEHGNYKLRSSSSRVKRLVGVGEGKG